MSQAPKPMATAYPTPYQGIARGPIWKASGLAGDGITPEAYRVASRLRPLPGGAWVGLPSYTRAVGEAWGWWLFFVGLALGIAGYWLVSGRVQRADDDLAADERTNEAAWISRTVASWGGEAPADLVAQVLDLHRRYLGGAAPLLAPEEPPPPEEPQAAAGSTESGAADTTDVEGDGAHGQAAEAHVDEAG